MSDTRREPTVFGYWDCTVQPGELGLRIPFILSPSKIKDAIKTAERAALDARRQESPLTQTDDPVR